MYTRQRNQAVDRHNIPDPYLKDLKDMKDLKGLKKRDGTEASAMVIFAETIVQKRVGSLFKTSAGVRGHAKQIQQEINRLDKVEGRLWQ